MEILSDTAAKADHVKVDALRKARPRADQQIRADDGDGPTARSSHADDREA